MCWRKDLKGLSQKKTLRGSNLERYAKKSFVVVGHRISVDVCI